MSHSTLITTLILVLLEILEIKQHGCTDQKTLVRFRCFGRKDDFESIQLTAEFEKILISLDDLSVRSSLMILHTKRDRTETGTAPSGLTKSTVRRVDQVVGRVVQFLIDAAAQTDGNLERILNSTQSITT